MWSGGRGKDGAWRGYTATLVGVPIAAAGGNSAALTVGAAQADGHSAAQPVSLLAGIVLVPRKAARPGLLSSSLGMLVVLPQVTARGLRSTLSIFLSAGGGSGKQGVSGDLLSHDRLMRRTTCTV